MCIDAPAQPCLLPSGASTVPTCGRWFRMRGRRGVIVASKFRCLLCRSSKSSFVALQKDVCIETRGIVVFLWNTIAVRSLVPRKQASMLVQQQKIAPPPPLSDHRSAEDGALRRLVDEDENRWEIRVLSRLAGLSGRRRAAANGFPARDEERHRTRVRWERRPDPEFSQP